MLLELWLVCMKETRRGTVWVMRLDGKRENWLVVMSEDV